MKVVDMNIQESLRFALAAERFLTEAAKVMHPNRPIAVTFEDCLAAIEELYPTQEALAQAEHEKRMAEQEARDIANTPA